MQPHARRELNSGILHTRRGAMHSFALDDARRHGDNGHRARR
jgi:hypothetical protein